LAFLVIRRPVDRESGGPVWANLRAQRQTADDESPAGDADSESRTISGH